MSTALWGGRAYKGIYRMKSDHSGILAADGTGSVISAADTGDAALILEDKAPSNIIVQTTDWTPDKDGVYTCTIETNDPAVLAFMDVACPAIKAAAGSVERKEYSSERGAKIGGASSSSGIPYLIVDANGEDDDGNVLTRMAVVTFSRESDKTKTGAGESIFWSMKATASACKKSGGFLIPVGVFEPTVWLVDDSPVTPATADRTIGEDYFIKSALLAKAA